MTVSINVVSLFSFFFSSLGCIHAVLRAGNSNSVANLVENENPTSMQSVPINDDTDILPNMDTDTLGNLTPFNNMKGSYNNLFCDNLDDETVQTFDHNDTANSQVLENVYCNVSPAKQNQSMTKSAMDTTTTTLATNVDNLLSINDPNLHVYSNVSNNNNTTINENETISTTATSTSTATNPTPKSNTTTAEHNSAAPIKSKLISDNTLNLNNIESIISQTMLNKSSKLLSDNLNDLDLDDPTLMGSTPNTSTMSKVLKIHDSIGMSNSKFSSSKKSKQSMGGGGGGGDDSHSSTSKKKLFKDLASPLDVMVGSLHDTTMIDTALDLDSLEDANIGMENVS